VARGPGGDRPPPGEAAGSPSPGQPRADGSIARIRTIGGRKGQLVGVHHRMTGLALMYDHACQG